MAVTNSTHYTLPKKAVYTEPASRGNAITKEYYNHLVGEINRGSCYMAVCRITTMPYNVTSYHLISL